MYNPCTVTEQELLSVVFTFDKFHSYLLGTRFIVHTDHFSLRYFDGREGCETEVDLLGIAI